MQGVLIPASGIEAGSYVAWCCALVDASALMVHLAMIQSCHPILPILKRGPMSLVDRASLGHLYLIARGEILGFVKDSLVRKRLPVMCSLVKNES